MRLGVLYVLDITSLTRSPGVRISRLSIPNEGLGIRGESTGWNILGRGIGIGEGEWSILSGGSVGQGLTAMARAIIL